MNKYDKKQKAFTSPKDYKNNKKPLFKIFMDENSKKKLHLVKNNISNSKDSGNRLKKNAYFYTNKNLNLKLFSYKILEAKHNTTPELYLKQTLNILIKKKKCHLLAYINEMFITNETLRDYLKRYYSYKEIEERIPKYVSYYKNYLKFFCRPFFVDYSLNKKMVRHMEKVAQIFYNENYADEDKEEEEKKNKNKKKEENVKNVQIFSKKIAEEIDNCDVFTVVTSEAALKQIQIINNKINKKILQKIKNEKNKNNKNNVAQKNNVLEKEKIDDKVEKGEKDENNIPPIQIEQLTIVDNNTIITPISSNDHRIENKIISELKNKDIIPITNNSINVLIDELEQKDNNKFNNNSKNKNDDNNNIMNKGKEIIKHINNKCIVIQGGKTTNNINININHLTIGQKLISNNDNNNNNKIINGLNLLNNNNIINNDANNNNSNKRIIKKLRHKKGVSNSVNTKDKNFNPKFTNNVESLPEHFNSNKNTKNCSLTLPPPAQAALSNNISKKNYHIIPYTINNNSTKQGKDKSTPLFKTNGSIASFNNFIKGGQTNNDNQNKNIGKNTIYTNKINYMKNILNSMSYGITTKLSKKNINKKIYTKNMGILSGERSRSISNVRKRPKRVIYSSLYYNGSNIQLLNSKNTLDVNKNIDSHKSDRNKIGIDLKRNTEKIPILKNKENFDGKISKLKIKDLKLKGNHLNIQKLLNFLPKTNSRTKSTGK